jgi:hypothetical protein
VKNPVTKTLVREEDQTEGDRVTETSSLLELIAERTSAKSPVGGIIVGKLTGFDGGGNPLVDFIAEKLHETIVARSMIALKNDQIGINVVLAFEHGKLENPIITGTLWQPEKSGTQEPPEAEIDGERLVLTANKEIVLRCGKASITLTRAGKVLIRGAYLLSRSSGVNQVKGGSVQIN